METAIFIVVGLVVLLAVLGGITGVIVLVKA